MSLWEDPWWDGDVREYLSAHEEDMRRTSGRYYPPEPRDECRCTPPSWDEPNDSLCAACEARMEQESDDK